MKMNCPELIRAPNLSLAWARSFEALDRRRGKEIFGLTVSFGGFVDGEPKEDLRLRQTLDDVLAEYSPGNAVQTVANTIFPQSLWRMAQGDREQLYSHYLENLPEYVRWEPARNRNGTYFSRLIAFELDPCGEAQREVQPFNQLEFIIQHCRAGKRRSYLQASIFDPSRDHSESAQLGFPCLQHITFVPDFSAGTLTLNAFYATQQLVDKAYGNFLGLARLGLFVAGQTNLALERVNCFIGVEKMDQRPRRALLDAVRRTVGQVLTAA